MPRPYHDCPHTIIIREADAADESNAYRCECGARLTVAAVAFQSDWPRFDLAHIIADAIYFARYPNAVTGVANRGHPSHDRIWRQADAIIKRLATFLRRWQVVSPGTRGPTP